MANSIKFALIFHCKILSSLNETSNQWLPSWKSTSADIEIAQYSSVIGSQSISKAQPLGMDD